MIEPASSPARSPAQPIADIAGPDGAITGASMVAAIRRAAQDRGQSVHRFAAQLSPKNLQTWLHQLTQAQRPKPHTIARVQALLAGDPVPDPPLNNFQNRARAPAPRGEPRTGPRMIPVAGRGPDPATIPRAPSREPCFRCGVRADIGCAHQRND